MAGAQAIRALLFASARALALAWPLALALAGTAAPAAPADPMQSAECQRLLDALEAQENALLSAPRTDRAAAASAAPARIDGLRRQAARACLGGSGNPPPPRQTAQPPVVVTPAGAAPRPARAGAALAVSPPRPDPSVMITSCDAEGCWANDGTRLRRSGNLLIGPRGVCRGSPGTPITCP